MPMTEEEALTSIGGMHVAAAELLRHYAKDETPMPPESIVTSGSGEKFLRLNLYVLVPNDKEAFEVFARAFDKGVIEDAS